MICPTEALYDLFLTHPAVTTDSRRITPGVLFFALRGEHFDGNRFAAAALDAGAAYAIVDDPAVVSGERFILVGDVLTALQQLAAYHRTRLGLPLLAITGTNGKTTTKELVAAVLSRKFSVEYTRGNLNNHIGVPLTLLSMTSHTEFGVVEMGANHPGEIDFLCRIATPDFGLITNVGKAHLEGFGSFEGVIRTKSELYRYLEEREGTIFVNGGNPWLTASAGPLLRKVIYRALESAGHDETGRKDSAAEKMDEPMTVRTSISKVERETNKAVYQGDVGLTGRGAEKEDEVITVRAAVKENSMVTGRAVAREDALVTGSSVGKGPFLEVQTREDAGTQPIMTHLVGNYNLENVLAAVAVGRHFGVPADMIREAIEAYVPSNNRSQWMTAGSCEIIMDAYNANPTSMLASVRNFVALDHPLKIVILGDMLELGEASAEEHQKIVDELALHFRKGVCLAGNAFASTQHPPGFIAFPTAAELAGWLREHLPVGALLLIKGSRGMQLEKIADLLRDSPGKIS